MDAGGLRPNAGWSLTQTTLLYRTRGEERYWCTGSIRVPPWPVERRSLLGRGVWLAVDEVVHHGHVRGRAVVRAERCVAVVDSDATDYRSRERDTEERQAVLRHRHSEPAE